MNSGGLVIGVASISAENFRSSVLRAIELKTLSRLMTAARWKYTGSTAKRFCRSSRHQSPAVIPAR
jgi:hypothetical protein